MLLSPSTSATPRPVVGLYDLEPITDPQRGRRRPARPLAHRHQRRAHRRRARADVRRSSSVPRRPLGTDDIDGIAISSGVPRVTGRCARCPSATSASRAGRVEPGVRTGLPILYDNPKEVGADRIANAVAAFDLFGGPTIVVDFGTATTFDAISAKGEYLGGAIAPGIEISLDALFGRAAALRRVELVEPRNVIGRTTVESMQSGAVYGYAALVDGIVRPHRGRAGRRARSSPPAACRRSSRPLPSAHRARRAVADPARPAPHLRAMNAER